MKFEYFIKVNGKFQQVSYEEYSSFDGEKEKRPDTWRYNILHKLLVPYRWL